MRVQHPRTLACLLVSHAHSCAGIIADKVFGYRGSVGREAGAGQEAANATALGNSLLAVLGIPWLLCFFAYFRAPLACPILPCAAPQNASRTQVPGPW